MPRQRRAGVSEPAGTQWTEQYINDLLSKAGSARGSSGQARYRDRESLANSPQARYALQGEMPEGYEIGEGGYPTQAPSLMYKLAPYIAMGLVSGGTLAGLGAFGGAAGAAGGGAAASGGAALPAVTTGVPAGLGSVGVVGAGAGLPAVTTGVPAALGTVGRVATMAGNAAPTATETSGINELLTKLLSQSSGGNPYLRMLLGGGMDILGSLLSGGGERQSFADVENPLYAQYVNPAASLANAMKMAYGLGDVITKQMGQGVQMKSAFAQPVRAQSIQGLPFQIGGGFGIDPAFLDRSLLSTPGIEGLDEIMKPVQGEFQKGPSQGSYDDITKNLPSGGNATRRRR